MRVRGRLPGWARVGAALATVLLILAGCGGDDDDEGSDRRGGRGERAADGSGEPRALPQGHTWAATAQPDTVEVYAEDRGDEPIHRLSNPNENGAPLTFLVDGRDVRGDRIPVYLPVQPNGSKGWVQAEDVRLHANPYRIRVEVGAHRLTVTDAGETVVETEVGLGQVGRETPTGLYYLKELIQPPRPDGLYGPYAYGISGFTNNPEVAEEFGDGGVVGIHGTNDPSSIGRNVSSGCIRVPNDVITEMVDFLPLGTPVEIIP